MKVKVKIPDGRVVEIDVQQNDTIQSIITKIKSQYRIDGMLEFYLKTEKIDSEMSIGSYK